VRRYGRLLPDAQGKKIKPLLRQRAVKATAGLASVAIGNQAHRGRADRPNRKLNISSVYGLLAICQPITDGYSGTGRRNDPSIEFC
jgi:hypothetical protein